MWLVGQQFHPRLWVYLQEPCGDSFLSAEENESGGWSEYDGKVRTGNIFL